jgi:hypothetical protein
MPNISQLCQQGFFMLQGPIESKKPEQDELPMVASATVPTESFVLLLRVCYELTKTDAVE